MTRLPLVDPNDPAADPSAREVLNAVIGRGGVAPNVFRAIANHPRALAAMAQFASTVYYRNSLTPAQRELTYLTASLINDCHY